VVTVKPLFNSGEGMPGNHRKERCVDPRVVWKF